MLTPCHAPGKQAELRGAGSLKRFEPGGPACCEEPGEGGGGMVGWWGVTHGVQDTVEKGRSPSWGQSSFSCGGRSPFEQPHVSLWWILQDPLKVSY